MEEGNFLKAWGGIYQLVAWWSENPAKLAGQKGQGTEKGNADYIFGHLACWIFCIEKNISIHMGKTTCASLLLPYLFS
jgi:hypothetical protein